MISIVICSADPDKARAVTAHLQSVLSPETFELLLIDGARSLSEGYNRGIAASRGDTLVFMHDDVEILTRQLVPRVLMHLQTYDVLGVAGTSYLMQEGNWITAGPPYIFGQVAQHRPVGYSVSFFGVPSTVVEGIEALDGIFIACKRAVVEAVTFDEEIFDGFHLYDLDFTFRAFQAGFRLAVCNDIPLLHASSGRFDQDYFKYLARFGVKHQASLRPRLPRRDFEYARVEVQTQAEILEVMRCTA